MASPAKHLNIVLLTLLLLRFALGKATLPNIFFQTNLLQTPNLDSLATNGLQLNNYYTQHLCSPSRHSLMSGRYPISDGMQQNVIDASQPYGMPLDLTTLPEMLKTVGYRTYMLGKWHLGFCILDYTPTRRGFDTHLGYWTDGEGYFRKNKSEGTNGALTGLDFRDAIAPVDNDEYSTYIYGNETLRLLRQHVADDTGDPFFLFFSSQAVHHPFGAPYDIVQQFMTDNIEDQQRAKLAAATTILDHTVGNIVGYMKSEESGNLWDNTLFIVSSDNGGMASSAGDSMSKGASNFPLRGGKTTLWEGGIRAIAYLNGGVLPDNRRGMEMNALMHISDWFPTLCSLSGIDYQMDGVQQLDGLNQLDNILYGETDKYQPRELLVHNIQPNDCDSSVCGSIRWRNYKIIAGSEAKKMSDECSAGWCYVSPTVSTDAVTVACSESGQYTFPSIDYFNDCPYNDEPCLFDMDADPCEMTDIKETEPEIYQKMVNLLVQYNATQKMPTLYSTFPDDYDGANPDLYGGFWSAWKEVAPQDTMMKVMDDVERGHSANTSALMVGAIVLIIAALAIKVLFDIWNQRRLYKEIGDKIQGDGCSSI